MDYQRLDIGKDELRLVYVTQDRDSLASSAVVELEMRTVSLQDYSSRSREYMASQGCTWYNPDDFSKSFAPIPESFDASAENTTFVQTVDDSLGLAMEEPDFGRWVWGDYQALSYTWQDLSQPRVININGNAMELTENLETFLRTYVNDLEAPMMAASRIGLWIDALCINQNDIEERNQQVKRMRAIYEQALATIIWLGEAADDDSLAIAMLESIATHQIDTRDEAVALAAISYGDPETFWLGAWTALGQFLCRPYWPRLWIIQEIALSHDRVSIALGGVTIEWAALVGIIRVLSYDIEGLVRTLRLGNEATGLPDNVNVYLPHLTQIQYLELVRTAVTRNETYPDLQRVLTMTRSANATDLKDKVYGILGLVDPNIVDLITPDYSLSLQDVYMSFTTAVIRSTGKLDIILSHGRTDARERLLPSWVPDWTEGIAVNWDMSPNIPYRASRDSTATVRFEEKALIARRFLIDSLDGLGIGRDTTGFYDANSDIVQPIDQEDPYGDEASRYTALWRTLTLNRENEGDEVPDAYESILSILSIPWLDYDDDGPADHKFLQVSFEMMRIFNWELRLGGRALSAYFPSEDGTASIVPTRFHGFNPMQRVFDAGFGHKLIVTTKGYFGQVRLPAQCGDIVCILLGCSVPVVLRKRADGKSYKVVSEAYIHVFSEGEAMEWLEAGQYSLEDLRIV